jgi:hypothetical protein
MDFQFVNSIRMMIYLEATSTAISLSFFEVYIYSIISRIFKEHLHNKVDKDLHGSVIRFLVTKKDQKRIEILPFLPQDFHFCMQYREGYILEDLAY